MDENHGPEERTDAPHAHSSEVPLLPMCGSLTILYTVLLEIGLVLGHRVSGGKWPDPMKYVVVAAIALIAGIYKVTLHKKHKIYVRRLFAQPLTPRQIFTMTCFLMAWVILGVWLMMGPPGPPFEPA